MTHLPLATRRRRCSFALPARGGRRGGKEGYALPLFLCDEKERGREKIAGCGAAAAAGTEDVQ